MWIRKTLKKCVCVYIYIIGNKPYLNFTLSLELLLVNLSEVF